MFKKLSFFAIFMVAVVLFQPDVDAKSSHKSCQEYVIKKKNLPLTIKKPGTYRFCKDLNWKPKKSGEAAITISSNDVTIDLDKYYLKQVNSQANCVGIQVNENLENIVVKNGSIQNITLWGVLGFQGIQNISFDKLSILACGYNGIDSVNNNAGGLNIYDINVVNGSTPNPINNVIINDCHFDNNYSNSTATNFAGIRAAEIYGANNVVVTHSTFNNNQSASDPTLPAGGAVKGLEVLGNGVSVTNCQFFGNVGLTNTSSFASNFFGDGIRISNCDLSGNSGSGIFNPNIDSGCWSIQLGGSDIIIENCVIQDNTSGPSGGSTVGIGGNGCADVVIHNCQLANLSSTNQVNGVLSLFFFSSNNILVENCTIQNITATGTGADGALGFFFGGDQNVVCRNCQAMSLACDAPNSNSYGFAFIEVENGTVENCIAQNITYSPDPTFAGGFYTVLTNAVEIIHCSAIAAGVGFYLDFESAQNSIIGNEALNNTVAGFGDFSGSTGTSANVFKMNEAYQNNGSNYMTMPAGTPIRTWNLTSGDQPNPLTDAGNPASNLDNINIQ